MEHLSCCKSYRCSNVYEVVCTCTSARLARKRSTTTGRTIFPVTTLTVERPLFFGRYGCHDYSTTGSSRRNNNSNITNNNKNQNNSEEEEEDESLFYEHWKNQLSSPPNLITLTRIASAPLLSYWIVTNQHDWAIIGCVLAGLSDVLDGYLAKHHQMSTVLGTYLDPLADKILINTLSISLWYTGTLPTPLVALWMMRDVGLTVGCYWYVAQHTSSSNRNIADPLTTPLKINPTLTSKVNTAFQFATLSVGILNPVYPVLLWDGVILTGLCWMTGATTMASGLSYLDYSAFSKSGNPRNDDDNNNDNDTSNHEEEEETKQQQQQQSRSNSR